MVNSSAAYACGAVLAVYFVGTFAAGLAIYLRVQRAGAERCSRAPVPLYIFHVVLLAFLLAACYTLNMAVFIGAGIFYILKLVVAYATLREIKAIQCCQAAFHSEEFLQNIRRRAPQAEIVVRCWHKERVQHYETQRDRYGRAYTRVYYTNHDVTTYREVRFVQLAWFQDLTPPLYINRD